MAYLIYILFGSSLDGAINKYHFFWHAKTPSYWMCKIATIFFCCLDATAAAAAIPTRHQLTTWKGLKFNSDTQSEFRISFMSIGKMIDWHVFEAV